VPRVFIANKFLRMLFFIVGLVIMVYGGLELASKGKFMQIIKRKFFKKKEEIKTESIDSLIPGNSEHKEKVNYKQEITKAKNELELEKIRSQIAMNKAKTIRILQGNNNKGNGQKQKLSESILSGVGGFMIKKK